MSRNNNLSENCEDDIIELDEDGNFNIPSPKKHHHNEIEIIELSEEQIHNNLSKASEPTIYQGMNPGEYKIYDDIICFIIAIKLEQDEIPLKCKYHNENEDISKLVVSTSLNQDLVIKLPLDCMHMKGKIDSCYYDSYFTAKILKQ